MKSNALIFGPIGRGKSYALRTLLKEYPDHNGKMREGAGLSRVGLLACEPGWKAVNDDLTCEMGFHAHECLPANPTWEQASSWLETISTMDVEAIRKMPLKPSLKRGYLQFMDLYAHCSRFVCERCGEDFGMIDQWGEDCAFATDGLTGISKMAVDFTVGPKPAMTYPEYDASQHLVEDFVDKLCALKCTYVLIAHWAREPREVEGGSTITINTIGQKLAGRLLLDTFDEVILAEREGNNYTWNMADNRVDQKARRLAYKAGLPPDFAQIFRKGNGGR